MEDFRIRGFLTGMVLLVVSVALRGETVDLQFREAAWFVEEIATAFVVVDSAEEPNVEILESGDEVRIYESTVRRVDEGGDGPRYSLVMEFVPRRTGLRTFPPVRLSSGERVWETRPKQFRVSETILSDRMSLTVEPAKKTIYRGEPLRIDFTWESDLPVGQLRAFRMTPAFFNDPDIKVFVPRSEVPSDEQMGLPVGGRRVITHRIHDAGNSSGTMGRVTFSVWLRFEEAGQFEIPPTRLLCALLQDKSYSGHQYASYFNNSLFEPVDRTKPYQRLEVRSSGFTVDVKPLSPEGRQESFSGLFSPKDIAVTVQPVELSLGQLMEIRVEVKSEVCSEMLELPPLALQRSLRHRFWASDEMSAFWHPDGRRFVARVRPLTANIGFFPSLEFQVFNPQSGDYEMIRTDSIPLQIASDAGKSYFSIENLPGAKRPLELVATGVWHNDKGSIMSDLGHALISFLAEGFFVFLPLGPILFFILRPWVLEMRRRVVDTTYEKRRAAFSRFKREVRNGNSSVEALLAFVADCFDRPQSSLTARDAGDLLRQSGCGEDSALEVEELLRGQSKRRYSPDGADGKVTPSRTRLNDLATDVYQKLKKATVVALAAGALSFSSDSQAATWDEAEQSFAEALELADAGVDSTRIEEEFVEAALAFESCAKEGIRSGSAWYNAGNAWFKAGEIGQAIASYRRAQAYRPFDERLQDSLSEARALQVDVMADGAVVSKPWPQRWAKALLSLLWLVAWGLCLAWVRYRSQVLRNVFGGASLAAVLMGGWLLKGGLSRMEQGVLVADEAYGRKGPSYAYQSAFVEPLHNGLELVVLERRDDWLRVGLGGDYECWLPATAVETL